MKTNDLIQLGLLGLIGYLAYQKFAKPTPKPSGNPPIQPYQLPDDMGTNNPNDASWGDATGSTAASMTTDLWNSLWEGL